MAWHCDKDGQATAPCSDYAPLAWSNSLFQNAQEFANDLVEDCKMKSPPKPWFDDGWNLGELLAVYLEKVLMNLKQYISLVAMPCSSLNFP